MKCTTTRGYLIAWNDGTEAYVVDFFTNNLFQGYAVYLRNGSVFELAK